MKVKICLSSMNPLSLCAILPSVHSSALLSICLFVCTCVFLFFLSVLASPYVHASSKTFCLFHLWNTSVVRLPVCLPIFCLTVIGVRDGGAPPPAPNFRILLDSFRALRPKSIVNCPNSILTFQMSSKSWGRAPPDLLLHLI